MRTNGAILAAFLGLSLTLVPAMEAQARQLGVQPGGMGIHQEGGAMDHASASRQIEKMQRRRMMQHRMHKRPMERRHWR